MSLSVFIIRENSLYIVINSFKYLEDKDSQIGFLIVLDSFYLLIFNKYYFLPFVESIISR